VQSAQTLHRLAGTPDRVQDSDYAASVAPSCRKTPVLSTHRMASTLSCLLHDEINSTLGQWAAGPPNGLEHWSGRRRIAAAGKETTGNNGGDQHLAALTALADD
jgi:hypothetical protein